MISEETYFEIWRALFMATPVFVVGTLILMAYWNWGIPESLIKRARKAKKTSFWVWIMVSVLEAIHKILRWIFSTAPVKLLAKIPGAIWGFGEATFNGLLNNMIKIGVALGMTSIALEFVHRQVEIMDNIGRYARDKFTLDPYARYVALLGIVCALYGLWRQEVKEND